MILLIYSEKQSDRLDYILDFIFNEVILGKFELTFDLNYFKKSEQPKLNFSEQAIENSLQIVPHTILYETTISTQVIDPFKWKGQTIFFSTSKNEIPFDIFGASFYLLSRFEEYLTKDKDEFKRFPHNKSVAFEHDFLNLPMIDIWALEFKIILQNHFSQLQFTQKEFQFIPTYDIDIAYSYKHKSLFRNTGGWLVDLLKSSKTDRLKVLLGNKKDPYDCYDSLDDLHSRYSLNPIYFFLLGRGGTLDKNLSPKNQGFKNLIKRIASKYQLGIHPSYRSNDDLGELNIEVQTLNSITTIQTRKSRQHYIRFDLPGTFKRLIEEGITDDYSMGYGSINGFRASTSYSFYWFDLSKNEKTELRSHPFCFMECNSFFEQKQNLGQTKKEIDHYITQVKNVNGTLISVWHNFSLGTDKLWIGWKELYVYQIETLAKK